MTDVIEVNELGENAELSKLNSLLNRTAKLLDAATQLEDGPDKADLIEKIAAQRISIEGIAASAKDVLY